MDDMSGLLAQNFGIRGQGKSAPMAASKTASTHRSVSSSSYDDIFNSTSSSVNNNSNRGSSTVNQTAHDPILDAFNKGPVFDTPAYDDEDIFNGVPGIRSSSTSSFKYDDVFASDRSPTPYDDLLGSIGKGRQSPPAYDDLLGGLGMGKRMDHGSAEIKGQVFTTGFEDLLPGFGSSTPMSQPEREAPHETAKTAATPSTENDPFFVVETGTSTGGSFSNPLDNLTKPSEAVKVDASSPTHSFFSENPPNSSDSMPSFSAATGGDFTQSERSVETEGGSDPFRGTTKYTTTYGGEGNDASKYEQSPESSEHSESGDDVWLTVSEIPLFTKPTSAPPPSRPAPPLSSSSSSPEQDEYGGEMERSSAAMKDAMNKAELKFKHAKEVREKMAANERDTKAELEMQERLRREEEQRRVERERGRERQAVERATREARERAANEAMLRAQRGAVQRAQQEARERAAQEAKEKAASAEVAREREREKAAAAAERAAAAAAAERAAKEKEAKERERRMQRAAVEKAAAEARERLAQAAKEKHQQHQTQQRPPAAAATSAHQHQTQQRPPAASAGAATAAQQNDDFDSIFGMGGSGGSRSSSVPKKNPQEPQAQNRTPSASAATVRKTAAAANMMDDLSAIFGGGGPSSSGEFQEIQGETEDRRKARFEREMRTRDRAAKALAEKNARDMQVQQEQAERHRIGETLDFEIKRWAAGKEGNLRSLLSSLHYILWAECGWQPVSMADLITGASVKKVYRKATLCIHPDKVQQKGATLQQKYIAEKVFDILKEAWNKFNSEELF